MHNRAHFIRHLVPFGRVTSNSKSKGEAPRVILAWSLGAGARGFKFLLAGVSPDPKSSLDPWEGRPNPRHPPRPANNQLTISNPDDGEPKSIFPSPAPGPGIPPSAPNPPLYFPLAQLFIPLGTGTRSPSLRLRALSAAEGRIRWGPRRVGCPSAAPTLFNYRSPLSLS